MSSLAQRRLGAKPSLQVLTKRDDQGKAKHTTIQLLDDGVFQQKYTIGDKVMDSVHRHMEIRYATRKVDGFKVVVKLRFKPGCFHGKTEEREWRTSTEFMLSLPPCEGVAQLFEVCEDNKAFYIVTELAKGMDLFEVLHSKVHFDMDGVREVMKPMLEAIAHFHENGCIHKDLKLENVVVDVGNGRIKGENWSPKSVKIIDFDTVEEWTPASPKAKDVLGTDQYIAQESYDGTYSPSSDIFALGVIMYKLATGKFPFKDEIFDDEAGQNYVGHPKMTQIRNRLKMAKINWGQECFVKNPALADLCARMLAFEVTDRPSAKDALKSDFFASSVPKFPTKAQGA